MTLPPGQHAVDGFPRWTTLLHRPDPEVPADPVLQIGGAVKHPLTLPLAALAQLPRAEVDADFHCVAGWSATGLSWEGVPFADFYRTIVEPRAQPEATATHLLFRGLDGYWSVAALEDALEGDVLIAEHLNGSPLDGDHGAPARLVSPSQYGFVSCKHLCGIELLTSVPKASYGTANGIVDSGLRLSGYHRYSRARVWEEERHAYLPAWLVRRLSPLARVPIRFLSARGSASRNDR